MNSPVERFERQYRAAAAEGAIVELRLRLLADKIPELQKFAHAQNLESVETLIVQHFSSTLTEEEAKTLELCRQLRNKLLHCDFRAARKKLEQLGVKTSRGGVKKIDVRGLSFPAQLIEKITSVKANVVGTFETVADSAFEAGSVFAWLIEVGQAGDFIQAVDAFARKHPAKAAGARWIGQVNRSSPVAFSSRGEPWRRCAGSRCGRGSI